MGSRRSDITKLIDAARRNGCEVTMMGNGHFLVSKGEARLVLPSSPGGGGAMTQYRARLRKRGLIL